VCNTTSISAQRSAPPTVLVQPTRIPGLLSLSTMQSLVNVLGIRPVLPLIRNMPHGKCIQNKLQREQQHLDRSCWWAYIQLRMGCIPLAYQLRAKLPFPKLASVGTCTVFNRTHSTVTFSKAMPVMPLTKAHFRHSVASVLHSPVLALQTVWPTRINVCLSATRCKPRSALVKWLAARKFMQQMIRQHHLIPYSILCQGPPYVHYAVPPWPHIDDRESLIWHTTPGAFVFQTRFSLSSLSAAPTTTATVSESPT
jgi:hypothetical protein